jgi:hypothetical protein
VATLVRPPRESAVALNAYGQSHDDFRGVTSNREISLDMWTKYAGDAAALIIVAAFVAVVGFGAGIVGAAVEAARLGVAQ